MMDLIRKMGTIDCDLVETTPVVFQGRLYRFEYVREGYRSNRTGTSYFRFIDVESGRATPAFAHGYHLGSAYVEGGLAYAYGVGSWGSSRIDVFRSEDLANWESSTALDLPGWGIYNTSVCRGKDSYIMAFEVGEPQEVVGRRFTIFFAESQDLLRWRRLPLDRVFCKERYTACPALRYFDPFYYMIYLEARPGPSYEPWVVRSRDLIEWDESPLNPVMKHSEEDRKIANPKLTEEERKRIRKADNINNSDVDLCELDGRTVIYYSWGNQRGNEFLAEAFYDGSLESFFKSFFSRGS